jgi:hypothetical protein
VVAVSYAYTGGIASREGARRSMTSQRWVQAVKFSL